jgi:sulfoxide reductase catalytic subunit YedY
VSREAKLGSEPAEHEVTSEGLYLRRREFLKSSVLFTATASGVGGSLLWLMGGLRADKKQIEQKTAGADPAPLATTRSTDYARSEDRTPYPAVTHYNNFYELGIDKQEGARALRQQLAPTAVDRLVRRGD